MPERTKIDCEKPSGRDALVQILARNGYTVRVAKEKRTAKSNYTYFVEYWRE